MGDSSHDHDHDDDDGSGSAAGQAMGDAEPGPAGGAALSIEELEEWLRDGATWRVVDIAAAGAAVQFCTCTGRALEVRRTSDPAVIAYLRTAHPELE